MIEYWEARGVSWRLLVAGLAVAGAVLLRMTLLDILGPRTPFLTFYPAIMLAALFGGLLSGLITSSLLALLACLWVLPQMQLSLANSAGWLPLLMFFLSGALISAISEALHRARRRTAQAEAQAALSVERCRVEADLQRLAAIVESSDDAIIGATMGGIITHWNKGAEHIYGYAAEEIIGRPAPLLCPPARIGEMQEMMARIATGERVQNYETVRQRKDGTLVDVAVTLSPIRSTDCALRGVSAVVRDITERKRADAALRESEAFSRTIIESSPDCIKMLNRAGELVYMSQGGLRLLEVEDSASLLGRPYMEFWKGTERERCLEALETARQGHVGRFDGFCPTAKGTPKWWDVAITPLFSPDGRIDRFLVVSRDETERKLSADALQAEKERLSAIINTSPDLMFLKDKELRYLAANAAHETVLGLCPRDMLGRTDFDLLPPDMAKSCGASDQAALKDGVVLQEEQVGDSWYQVSKRRVTDAFGEVLGVAALITDITERRRAYDALRQSEELFRQLVESAPDAIFVQTKGNFAFVNKACLQLYGAPGPEAMLGNPVLSRFHPDFHAQAKERIRTINEERAPAPAMEQRHLRFDGTTVDVEVSAVPLIYGGDNGALVFVRDITERKRVEALRDDIERIARHDLKTPLNAVINLPLLLMDDTSLSPKQTSYLRLIHEAGLRMLEQIDQSLTLYRIETGSFVLEPQSVDLAHLARQVSGELAALAGSLGVELSVEAQPQCVLAQGDSLLCRTMLSNLLKNAVEAAPRGSRALARLREEDGHAVVEIHNTGAVPEEFRLRFFDKYATHGKHRGAGLGTYSARLSAEAQGGSISLNTAEALGTIVTVRLPLQSAAA